ncbi:MAG TPA: SDR family NAD(P)-dependent oxidoreductase, partial [Thermoanaerobaculia bacterium]|nr:SDR family NAD(P)-dependent oxidoreductase [Thermoanaerobaculia bacterium]
GKKVLPGTAYLEMARAAVALSAGIGEGQIIVLGDSIFIQPMIVQGDCAVETKVYPGAPGEFGVEVVTSQGVHFQTAAHVRERLDDEPTSLDLGALEGQCTAATWREPQIYADFKRLGVHYGPSHRGIEEVRMGSDCALAALFLQGAGAQGMDLHPGMLDSVFQCAFVPPGEQQGIPVPFIVKSVRIYGPLPDRTRVWLKKGEQGTDFIITDDGGAVRVVIRGFVFRRLDLEAAQAELVYYAPEWRSESAGVEAVVEQTVIEAEGSYSDLVKSVIATAQRLIRTGVSQHVLEVRIPAERPEWRGIIGVLRTIHREYAKIAYRLRAGERYVDVVYSARELETRTPHRWADGKTVLITGGMGGLGRLIARDIATTTRGCTLILTGRGEPDAARHAAIERLEAAGAKVVYAQCDVGRRSDVEALVAQYPEISGVIHGAGVLRDGFIAEKTGEAIDEVLAPKVDGLENLDAATAALKLDYFVTLSSIAGTLGNAGQSDYAGANGFMDAFMCERARRVESGERHGRSISIDWPLWEGGGMQVDASTRANLQRIYKIRPLPDGEGLAALKRILAAGDPQMLVVYGEKKEIAAMLEKVGSRAEGPRPKTVTVEPGKLVREILREVKIQTAEHLGLRLPPAQLDEEADWAEFGFDSIILSGFVNKLNERFNLDLLPTALFEATNMLRFSEYLARNYGRPMADALSLGGEETVEAPAAERAAERAGTFARAFRKAWDARVSYREEDIAIVGMSCRTAGARTVDELWRLLSEEKDMITEIPRDRWDWRAYPEAAKWGSFLEGVDEFDSLFFGISPAEATYMAPEQRLMMESVWECLEDAGCGDSIRGTNTGIFIGCGASSYTSMLGNMPIQAYSSTGAVPSVGPNRISYLM